VSVNKINNRAPSVLTINLEKSFDPRKKRKYSKGYKIVSRHLKGIGIYTSRHPGRDCRDPDAMDGNIELRKLFFSYIKLLFI